MVAFVPATASEHLPAITPSPSRRRGACLRLGVGLLSAVLTLFQPAAADPDIVTDAVAAAEAVDDSVEVLCGAGISTGEDLTAAEDLGAEGVLLASGVAKADDPAAALEDLVEIERLADVLSVQRPAYGQAQQTVDRGGQPVTLDFVTTLSEKVRAAVEAQAHVTHNNPDSDAACLFLALTVQDAIAGAPLRDLYRRRIRPFVAAHPVFAYRPRRRENPSGWVAETLQAVLQSLLDTGSFEDCLLDVVNRGGDADTTGAIAGMLAGALYGLDALPSRWLRALDPATREACRVQARALLTVRPPAT